MRLERKDSYYEIYEDEFSGAPCGKLYFDGAVNLTKTFEKGRFKAVHDEIRAELIKMAG